MELSIKNIKNLMQKMYMHIQSAPIQITQSQNAPMRSTHTQAQITSIQSPQNTFMQSAQAQSGHVFPQSTPIQNMQTQSTPIQGCRLISRRKIFMAWAILLLIVSAGSMLSLSGCRQYDNKIDAVYYFKTDPEKAVLDFMYAMNNHDAQYIYTSLLPDRDKRNIDKEKFVREMDGILSDVESIKINQITYLGYENEMSKVVIDFSIKYSNGASADYRKYIYLLLENGNWKIVFDKTFI